MGQNTTQLVHSPGGKENWTPAHFSYKSKFKLKQKYQSCFVEDNFQSTNNHKISHDRLFCSEHVFNMLWSCMKTNGVITIFLFLITNLPSDQTLVKDCRQKMLKVLFLNTFKKLHGSPFGFPQIRGEGQNPALSRCHMFKPCFRIALKQKLFKSLAEILQFRGKTVRC